MKNWFVLNTKPKKEFQVEKIFSENGYKIYNPKYKQENRIRPFFAGYEFIYFDYPSQYRTVKYTRGVKKIIGNEQGPIPIHEKLINEIKKREIDGFIELNKYGSEPKSGDEVQVMEGAMKGLKGIFKKEITPKERALILLNYVSYQGHLIIDKKKLKKVL
ncbi:MAG TPA: transcription termination/antitermination NusG family protein [Acidobacteriota bacterium]|nr:transcription termination/antitermination NusG family protein [Acidobacteriota bacterium]